MNTPRITTLNFFICFAMVSLLISSCSNPVEDRDDDHEEAEGLVLSLNGADIVTVKEGKVMGSISVTNNQKTSMIDVLFLDAEGNRFQPSDTLKTLEWSFAASDIAEAEQEGERWKIRFKGRAVGQTTFDLRLMHGGHADFITPQIPITVTQ